MGSRKTKVAGSVFLSLFLLLVGLPPVGQPARAATYTVTNTNDSGAGSLRQAIIDANNHSGADTVSFNIPSSDPGYSAGTGVWVIAPTSPLPTLTGGQTTIDAATQTANQGDTNLLGPEVQIDGTNLGGTDTVLTVQSNDNTVQGVAITRGGGTGIKINAGAMSNTIRDSYIGTDPTGTLAWGNGTGVEISGGALFNDIESCIISGNTGSGVKVTGAGTDFNDIMSSLIGLDATGAVALPNGGHGVFITAGAGYSSVGGDVPYRNTISGNGGSGVLISGPGSDTNWVWFNYIGTDSTGAVDVGNGSNGFAVSDGAQSNLAQENVISGNDQHGVYLTGSGTDNNFVRLNIVGADAALTQKIPNGWHGVAVYEGAQSNWIGTISPPWGNTIVGSSWTGVAIVRSDQNTVIHNAIGTTMDGAADFMGNGYYGVFVAGMNNTIGPDNTIAYNGLDGVRVDAGFTPSTGNRITQNSIYANTAKGIELVDGGNNELSAPVISLATCDLVEGSTGPGYTIEVFSDAQDEGRFYQGTTTAHAILPSFSYDGWMTGHKVTVTATDTQGNTSEFSAPEVRDCLRVWLPAVLRK